VASSGHTRAEEVPADHVPLDGNKLKVLGRMDIPGLDMLSSNPEIAIHSGWLTAAMPFSAAMLQGRRRIMTEVSDFTENKAGRGPAPLEAMQATAAWQSAWGVTEFTLYYDPAKRSDDDYRAYCRFVGRLNAALRPARPEVKILLYYPIYDLWAEYLPVAPPLRADLLSPRARRLIDSFMRLGQMLQRKQLPFMLIDHEGLAAAKVNSAGELVAGVGSFQALILPDGAAPPAVAENRLREFRAAGGQVLFDREEAPLEAAALTDAIKPACRLSPDCEAIVAGWFRRDGAPILLLVNVGLQPYQGRLRLGGWKSWARMDPCTGAVDLLETDDAGGAPLTLNARQTLLFLGVKQ